MVFELLSVTEYRALCLVNTDFRAVAEIFLYSKIQWTWKRYRSPPITQLLRTIISRPQLAAYITHVCLDGQDHQSQEFRYKLPKIPVSKDELDEPIAFIRRAGVPYSDLWIQELRKGKTDALVALLLAQLSNVTYLYIGHDFTRQSTLVGMVLRSAFCEPGHYRLPDFRHLRDVSFLRRLDRDEACDQTVKNTADILPLLYLPNVQRMSISVQNPDEFTWPAAHLPVPSRLTSLCLTAVREGCLGELLAVTPNLEFLCWSWYFDSGVRDRFTTQTIDLDQIAAAISHVRGSLKHLIITADCEIAFAVGDQLFPGLKAEGSLCAMVNFDMLKRLQIPWAFLVGFAQDTTKRLQDVIPKNIEVLTITDDLALQNTEYLEPWPAWEWNDYAIIALLESWLRDWKTYTPHLRNITLRLVWTDTDIYEWSPRARHQLGELSTQVGVPIELDLS